MTKYRVIAPIFCLILSACASQSEPDSAIAHATENVQPLGNVELYTHKLANELFAQTRPARQSKYAVVGFVPVPAQEYQSSHHHPLQLLGHQLKEGLMTEAAKRGYATQEFLLSGDIKVTGDADSVLTRNVENLSGTHRVDYFITGTVLHQERGAMVNARIIHARSKEIVAAATSFFPMELFWQGERVITRNGRLMLQQTSLNP